MARTARFALVLCIAVAGSGCALLHDAQQTGPSYVDDSATSARVKTALLQDPSLQGSGIDVKTTRGTVTLGGVVESVAMEERAAQIARAAPGVKDVKNALHVAQVETGTALR